MDYTRTVPIPVFTKIVIIMVFYLSFEPKSSLGKLVIKFIG